jgi:hypothetical protein
MHELEIKSTIELFDMLITCSMRTWHNQEDIMNKNLSDSQVADAARKAQTNNKVRNQLMQILGRRLGDKPLNLPADKTY